MANTQIIATLLQIKMIKGYTQSLTAYQSICYIFYRLLF